MQIYTWIFEITFFFLGNNQQMKWYNTVVLDVKWMSEIYSYLSFIVPVKLEVFLIKVFFSYIVKQSYVNINTLM